MTEINKTKERVQPKIYHIHIDAKEIDRNIYNYAINELKFWDSDFDGHLREFDYSLPNKHLTLKVKKKNVFEERWSLLEKKCKEGHYIGYLEGEYIPVDELIPYKKYNGAEVPFKINRRKLDPVKGEEFRQTEIHVTFKKEESSEELINNLMDSGFYGINVPKKDGVFVCFTAQGYVKTINKLRKRLTSFLIKSGGAYRCTIKEERTVHYSLFDIDQDDLMEIVDNVEYFE